jgi:hypothetical protein
MTVGLHLAVVLVIGLVAIWLAQSQPLRGKLLIYGLAGGAGLLALLRTCIKRERGEEKSSGGSVGASTDKVLEFGSIILMTALLVNLGTNRLQAWIDKAPVTADELYRNHDLARLTGTAIGAVLEKTAQQPECAADADALKAIADGVRQEIIDDRGPRFKWELWMPANAPGEGNGIAEPDLVKYIRDRNTTARTEEVWTKFLHTAAVDCEVTLDTQSTAMKTAARRLHDEFGDMLREALKHDHSVGGEASKAFAAMELDVSGELLRTLQPATLTLYHVAGPGDRREVTLDYEHVPLDQQMRLQVSNADVLQWCILTIDGQGAVAIVRPSQLEKDADGLYAWQPTAASSETVILLLSPRGLGEQQQADITRKIDEIMQRSGAPALESGWQIVWGEEAGGWKRVKNGRGAAVAPVDDDGWPTQVCNVLRSVPDLEFSGRTVAVTPAKSP